MGIDLGSIKDIRLRQKLEAQLLSTPLPARPHLTPLDSGKPGEGVERERDLHDDIIDACRSRGWFYVHSRMDRATTVGVGTPDFCIALPNGRTVWLECKRRGGKPTLKQQAVLAWLQRFGHEAHLVDGYGQVMHILEGEPPD